MLWSWLSQSKAPLDDNLVNAEMVKALITSGEYRSASDPEGRRTCKVPARTQVTKIDLDRGALETVV